MKKWIRKALIILGSVLAALTLLAGYLYWEVTRDTPRVEPIETTGCDNPFITPLGTTMLSGHRSGGGIAPENTMMALKNCAGYFRV